MSKRVFLIVLDSYGIGYEPDADEYGDWGSNTLKTIVSSDKYSTPNMAKMGLFNIDGIDYMSDEENPVGAFGRMQEMSKGKDTTVGHWEIAGIVSENPFPTYPNGFPLELIEEIERSTHRTVIGNIASDGEILINQLGDMQIEQKAIIIYTSCDSVLQVAAHEDVIPVEELYKICEKIRFIVDKHDYKIGRIIARPFTGKNGRFIRTGRRKDFSLEPPRNVLDVLYENHIQTICIGKIGDMFGNKSISYSIKTKDNIDTYLEYSLKNLPTILFSIDILSTINSIMITFKLKLPPYDKNGKGTPVKGIKAREPIKLINKCNNKKTNVP